MGRKAETSRPRPAASRFRIGLQMKCALILTCLVSAVVVLSAWSYYRAVYEMMRQKDYDHAVHLGKAFSVAAEADLRESNEQNLRDLARDWVKGSVVYVAIVDHHGEVVACYGRLKIWHGRGDTSPGLLRHGYHGPNHITIARPVIARDKIWLHDRLSGGVRAVLDTSQTTRALRAARRRIIITAGGIELLALPIGFLLIWRVLLRPFGKLIRATRRLADGDYAARAGVTDRDEAGELGAAFDHMADQVASMRFRLLRHQDQLEHQVDRRTDELQKANGRLREEMKDKEEFLRAVSHDLNAPMRNVAGMATMIVMKYRDALPEEVLARLQRIQSNVDQQSSLIDELLEISRIRSRSEKRTETDVGELLHGLAGTFEYEIQKQQIELTMDSSMPTLWVEKQRLRQAFQNLIDNAIKYMHRPTGGRIEVRYHFDGATHEFEVRDNGPGIASEQLETIFTVFRRGAHPAEQSVKGKGVGLTVVRTIAAKYDGQAWVESVLGEGTTFHFTLADACVHAPEEVAHAQ